MWHVAAIAVLASLWPCFLNRVKDSRNDRVMKASVVIIQLTLYLESFSQPLLSPSFLRHGFHSESKQSKRNMVNLFNPMDLMTERLINSVDFYQPSTDVYCGQLTNESARFLCNTQFMSLAWYISSHWLYWLQIFERASLKS